MKNIPFGKPIIGEEEKKSVLEILDNPILVHGPKAQEFEKLFAEYTGADYAISVSSCTAALHLSYFIKGITIGDEVIVPAQTHTATAHAVELAGAKPVFVDAESETGNINIDEIESKITGRTKALSLVHFLGMPVNMDEIIKIAKKYNLFVVEDCALAIGTYFNDIHAGLHGDVGCFSFYPVKHMTTAEGGMLITNNEEIAFKVNKQKAFGVDRHVGERKIPGVYDVKMLGFNYRLNEIQAALGIEQLKKIDSFLKSRENNFNYLRNKLLELDEIFLLKSSYDKYKSSYYCLSIILKDKISDYRFEIVDFLKNNGVGTSVYYPKPVPLMSYYKNKYSYKTGDFPNAEIISNNSIALPVGPHLNEEDMEYIASVLKKALSQISK